MTLPVAAAKEEKDAPAEAVVSLVRVHLPLTGNADQALQATIRRTRDQLFTRARQVKDERRPVLVLELDPLDAEESQSGSHFERAFALARFLCSREMAGVKTVAYVPQSLRGHGVLLALACEELIMAPEALIGEAAAEETLEGTIRQTVVAAYREIAETQRTIPAALAVGMIDPAVEVLQIEAEDGVHFVLEEERESFADTHEIIEEQVLVPAGTLAQFDGSEGRQFGFVKYLARDRQSLARALDVPIEALEEVDALAEEWRPVVIDVQGEIDAKLVSRVETLLGTSTQQGNANLVFLRIDSAGGDLGSSIRLASTVARIDANSVRTVAYVPTEATGGAALVALACHHLVMHSDAKLGSSSAGLAAMGEGDAQLEAARQAIRHSLAPRVEHGWSLLTAMIDPGVQLEAFQNRASGEVRLMSSEEVEMLPDADAWKLDAPGRRDDESLTFTGIQSEEVGLATRTVESFDGLKQAYTLEADPPNPQPNRALEFVEALASPEFAVILLMIGFAGIYLELRTPGIGAGAFVGSVALMLFFWSKYLDGTAGWLEVLLFIAGISCVLLEIFVLPGFGIFGLGGGGLILASLVLASLTFVRPHSESEMEELARSVGSVAIAGFGVLIVAMVSRRYLPQAPVFRNIVLAPPEPEERDDVDHRESFADFSDLLGAPGVAATDLRPSGKATIHHELIDVIASGEPLARGTSIVVVEVRGNRVVVQSADQA